MAVTSMTSSHQFATDGFLVLPDVVDDSACIEISRRIEALKVSGAGSRRMLEQPWCAAVAVGFRMNPAVQVLLPEDALAVQCTLFSKSLEKNWLVTNAGIEHTGQAHLSEQSHATVRTHLEVLRLITANYSQSVDKSNRVYWNLTDRGRQLMSELRAVRKK
jgi:hypothetical protein